MSKDDVNKLRQFIEDTPQIKNVLSITFDPTGKNGTYFKPRNLNKLSGGQLLRDILIQKDHIFPVKEVSMIEEPTRTTIGKFGLGGALLETPFNKVLTTGYFNNSLRNKIQNFLNSGQLINQKEAIKQIDNTLKGLDTTIYHNGNYYGGPITPSVERQIKKLGFDKFDIQEDVVKNIKEQATNHDDITKNSVNAINEFKYYKWLVDKNGQVINKPATNQLDHLIDSIRYVALNKLTTNYSGKYYIL